jgi:PAB-dependent poly(A)-specific ribonuclease subunit 2
MIRNIALHHTATACLYENCLLCELGFLIDMLEKAGGRNCQATNFLKTFSSLSNAASLNLLEEHSPNTPLADMIQSVNRFLLDKFSADYRQMSPQNPLMQQLLATKVTATIRCAHCTHEQMRAEDPPVHELVYPVKSMMRTQPRVPRPTFSQILKQSVERQDQTRGWCPRCKRYQQLSSRKQIMSVPAVMMINTAIHGVEAKLLWSQPGWLPQEIGVIVQQGQFFCYEGQDLELHKQRGVYNVQVYELIGAVSDINSGESQKPHLVSLIDGTPALLFSQWLR